MKRCRRAHAYTVAALLLIMCSAASATRAPLPRQRVVHRTPQHSPDSSPSGLTDSAAPWSTWPAADDGRSLSDRTTRADSSLAAGISAYTAGDVGSRPHTDSAHDSGGDTASAQQPLSFPKRWLARQEVDLLASSVQALRQQTASEQVKARPLPSSVQLHGCAPARNAER